MVSIEGEAALAEFRQGLTGPRGLELLRQHGGQALIQLPVGVGKSRFLDKITVEAAAGDEYDLVVVLCPTRRLIDERAPLASPPAGVAVVNLRPRPASRCGPERDARWGEFESMDLGALGRIKVCGPCPLAGGCFWPGQYGKALRGTDIIYATQAHLERSPGFLARLQSWVGAERPLTLFDESDFVGKGFGEAITADELARFTDTLRAASTICDDDPLWEHGRWLALAEMLADASTGDLQSPGWRMPWIYHDWAVTVQQVGVERHPGKFRFLAYMLTEFGYSPVETRRKSEDGEIQFGTRPYIGDCLIFTGTTDLQFARYRLGKELGSPFADYRFSHPETRWYNLASSIGTRRHFARHLPQVLDFFAGLTTRRLAEGKRVVLVAKKCFVPICAEGLTDRFAALGVDLRILTGNWSEAELADPCVIPLISYGMIGTNMFEKFDCVFTLTGYYVDESVIDQCLQDLTRQDLRLPLRIETVGDPKRRRAGVADAAHRYHDIARLAQSALEFKESGIVVQTVGRVRPFTRAREVFTFQMDELPGVRYTAEFRTLAEARRHFGVPSARERQRAKRTEEVALLRWQGLTQAETATELEISERTVRNHETRRTGNEPS